MSGKYDLNAQKDLTRTFEGLRLSPYRDIVGKLTIGYGRNLDDRGISRPEAEILLEHDLLDAYEIAQTYEFFEALSSNRKLVIVDMLHNLGGGGFSKFKKFHAALTAANYSLAADEMLDSKWAAQVGRRARILARIMRFDH